MPCCPGCEGGMASCPGAGLPMPVAEWPGVAGNLTTGITSGIPFTGPGTPSSAPWTQLEGMVDCRFPYMDPKISKQLKVV